MLKIEHINIMCLNLVSVISTPLQHSIILAPLKIECDSIIYICAYLHYYFHYTYNMDFQSKRITSSSA